MRLSGSLALAIVSLVLLAAPCLAEGVPLLDGHTFHGKVSDVTAEGFNLEIHTKGGGTVITKVSADHVDPHWWYARREAALGDDVKGRLTLSIWAVEHGLFPQAQAQFEKARKLDANAAKEFQDHVVPGLREGIAGDLLHAAHRTMDAGKLSAANKMLQAVLTRFGDTHAAADARTLLPTLQHRMDAKLKELAFWKKFGDDERAREKSDQRRKVTDPIAALIRQGNNIMGHMPPMAAQADAVTHTRQAAVEFKKAIAKVDMEVKDHKDDSMLVKRLEALRQQAHDGLVQSHVTAGDVYASTGNYTDALGQADQLEAVDAGSVDAHALRARVDQAQAWSGDGIVSLRRWAGRGHRR